jgi:hypothetical protein
LNYPERAAVLRPPLPWSPGRTRWSWPREPDAELGEDLALDRVRLTDRTRFFSSPDSLKLGALIYSVLGLVIFAGFTMFDFQRLRRSAYISSAPFLAASIFLDILNVFLFFLTIFSSQEGN